MKTQTDEFFFLDFLQNNPAWEELFNTLSQFNDELNLPSIEQLLRLRKIDSTSTTDLTEQSVRQLGINIARDMMEFRVENYKSIFNSMPDYNQVAGTTQWPKFVSMLLGGQFDSYRLYTSDYRTFVPTPLGTLIQSGGTWYKTTHVDLEVDANLIYSGLDLTIDGAAGSDIVAALIVVGMTEQEAVEWHLNHVGFDPVNLDIYQRTAREVMFNRRLSELFYQWAPLEEVLHGVFATVNIAASISLSAHTVVESTRRFVVGAPLQSGLQFIEPKYVHGGEPVTFGVIVNYSDNTSVTAECYVQDNAQIESRDGNSVTFKEPASITTIALTVTYGTDSHQITVGLYPLGIEPDPKSLTINAPTLYGSSNAKIRVYGKYDDGTTKDLTESGTVLLTSTVGTFDGSTLVLPSVAADTVLEINAHYQGIGDVYQTKEFDLLRSVLNLIPVHMDILVPDTITQGIDQELRCVVTYNDNTSKIIVPQFKATSPDITIVENLLKSNVQRTDYMTSLTASFMDDTTVSATVQIKLRAPQYILAAVDIILPDRVVERTIIRPQAKALYVTENATAEQIAARDPSIIVAYVDITGQWFSSEDLSAGIHNLPDVDKSSGQFDAPTISEDEGRLTFNIHVTVIDNTMTRTFTRLFDIYDTQYVPKIIDIVAASSISNGSTIPLPTAAKWNTGETFAAAAQLSVEYIPSQSAKDEALQRLIELQTLAVAAGQDPTVYDTQNIDYSRWVTVLLSDGTRNIYDPVMQRQQPVKYLYFSGDLHGAARITMSYTFGSTTINNVRDIQLVPKRALVTDITIECGEILNDQSRTFVRLFATYADNSSEYVLASNWFGQWPNQDTDDYQLMKFLPGTYAGMAVVSTIEGREPTDIKDFLSMKVSRLPMFANIGTLEQLRTTFYDGAVLQIGKANVAQQSEVVARFYRIEKKLDVLIIPTPRDSINTILNSRIDGATQFSAGVVSESYALVNTYQLNGIRQALDGSYYQADVSSFDVEVSATWSIENFYLTQEGPNGTTVLVPTTDVLAAIDDDGYVTPSMNVNGAINIRAQFLCDGAAIERFLMVYMTQANEYLRSISITGQDIVWDLSERNATVEFDAGRWFIPYGLRIILNDNTEIVTKDALWEIGLDTNVEAVSIDSRNGRLYIGEQQWSDAKIRINATYATENPLNQQDETIIGTRVITLNSTRTITDALIELPLSNIEPNKEYQAIMNYTRRSGAEASSVSPDSDTVKFEWYIQESVPGFTLDPATGKYQFAASKNIQQVQIGCVLTEQRTTIDRTIIVVCPGTGYPQELAVTGFVNVRDDSTMDMKALLSRSGTFVKDDVTASCLWQVTNDRGDSVTVQGVSITQSGKLIISKLLQDTTFGVRATYIEGQVRLTYLHIMTAASSYPRYGTAPYGVNTMAQAEAALTDRLRSAVGGQFLLSPKTEEYGYFACRESYGDAKFAAGSDSQGNINPDWNGFDGARWPITGDNGLTGPLVVRKVYDNISENIHIYRTNARAFGTAVITVRYQ